MTNNTLLDLSTITEPFDLATALVYMKENGEFIRCKSETQDFYMYRDVQKRPAVVDGRRQYVDVDSVWAYNQWGGISTSINIADLFKKDFYVMKFDENGNPDWSQPAVGVQPMPGQEIVREAIKTSWTIDKIAGVVVVILAILLVSMVVSQNAHIKRLIGNFQKTNDALMDTNRKIASDNQHHMEHLTTAVNNLASETRNDITDLKEQVSELKVEVRDQRMTQQEVKDE